MWGAVDPESMWGAVGRNVKANMCPRCPYMRAIHTCACMCGGYMVARCCGLGADILVIRYENILVITAY